MESENFFEESDDILSETKETIGREGTWNGMKVFVIDTPGMNDSDGVEAKHLIAMIDYLKVCLIIFILAHHSSNSSGQHHSSEYCIEYYSIPLTLIALY